MPLSRIAEQTRPHSLPHVRRKRSSILGQTGNLHGHGPAVVPLLHQLLAQYLPHWPAVRWKVVRWNVSPSASRRMSVRMWERIVWTRAGANWPCFCATGASSWTVGTGKEKTTSRLSPTARLCVPTFCSKWVRCRPFFCRYGGLPLIKNILYTSKN